ncbi:MAG: ABC transporter substrate-binding protein [Chloroflexi bacterium]|nr:ABC transporter substrate-binding protein [Chloroflexota bacterium]
MKNRCFLATLGALALVLAACGSAATATPRPQATPTTAPTAAPVAATASPKPTVAPPPGATLPPAPRATPTAAPAAAIKSGGTLNAVIEPREPRGWDGWYWKSGAGDVRWRHNLVFSQLFNMAPTAEKPCTPVFRPELAQSWNWVTDRTLEVKLPQGVKFHNKPPVNGREMTSDDVVWSATRFIKEDTIRSLEATAPHVTKIEATDRYTVRFHLDVPLPTFLTEGLTTYYGALILPREVVDEKGRWIDPAKSYIGTGPFAFKEHVPGVRSTFVKNPEFFKKGLPYLDTIRGMVIPDIATQVASLRSGAIDMIYDAPAPIAAALKGQRGMAIDSCPGLGSIPARIHFDSSKPPFNDVRVRRAVQIAMDREGMVKAVLQGQGVTGPHYSPTISPYWVGWDELPPEVAQWVKYDPQRARQLLAEAGYPKGFDAGMKVNSGYTSPFPELTEAVVGLLRDAGINVKPHYMTSVEYAGFTNSGDWGADLLSFGQIGEASAPISYATAWYSTAPLTLNYGRISDPEVDRLLDQILLETNLDKQMQLFKQMNLRMIDQAWQPTPGTFPMEFTAMRDTVRGFSGRTYQRSSTYLEQMWLDQ